MSSRAKSQILCSLHGSSRSNHESLAQPPPPLSTPQNNKTREPFTFRLPEAPSPSPKTGPCRVAAPRGQTRREKIYRCLRYRWCTLACAGRRRASWIPTQEWETPPSSCCPPRRRGREDRVAPQSRSGRTPDDISLSAIVILRVVVPSDIMFMANTWYYCSFQTVQDARGGPAPNSGVTRTSSVETSPVPTSQFDAPAPSIKTPKPPTDIEIRDA